jgi:hypothetical protein
MSGSEPGRPQATEAAIAGSLAGCAFQLTNAWTWFGMLRIGRKASR